MKSFIVLVIVIALSATVKADNWAVLAAGSKGYPNYRHQADVCHAYQVLVEGGIDPEKIIVFLYDDVANNRENPFPGKLFNKQTLPTEKGRDVYKGCVVDYGNEEVNSKNWEAVLLGNKNKVVGGTGRVLESTKEDRVFLNFVDHGGVGLIAFPTEYYHAKNLQSLLIKMHSQDMFKELIFYLETCESGSMFTGFPTDLNIYATTAANAKESSWGTYCSPDDVVNGKHLKTCLGDLYSVNWMQDTESEDRQTETLAQQYKIIQKETKKSHVSEYGDLSIGQDSVGSFLGLNNTHNYTQTYELEEKEVSMVDSRDIKLHYLMNMYNHNPTIENYLNMKEEQLSREYFDIKFKQLAISFGAKDEELDDVLQVSVPLTQDDCHIAAIRKFENSCRKFTEYGLKYTRFLCTVCESGLESSVINQKIAEVCR